MRNRFFHFVLSCILGLISLYEVTGQDKQINVHDFLLPAKGKSILGIKGGILVGPVVEYSLGISNRFSVGISAGITGGLLSLLSIGGDGFFGGISPAVNCGIKLNALIAQPVDRMRIYLTAPLLYTFKSDDFGGPSFLISPSINVEWKLKNGTRIWIGSGVQKSIAPENENYSNPVINTSSVGLGIPLSGKSFFIIEINPAGVDFSLSTLSSLTFGFSFAL